MTGKYWQCPDCAYLMDDLQYKSLKVDPMCRCDAPLKDYRSILLKELSDDTQGTVSQNKTKFDK